MSVHILRPTETPATAHEVALASYIEQQRIRFRLSFGKWEDSQWDITEQVQRGKKTKYSVMLFFQDWSESEANSDADTRNRCVRSPIPSPYSDFAKAYLLDRILGSGPTTYALHLHAVTSLCEAMTTAGRTAAVTKAHPYDFGRAAELVRQRFRSESARFNVGSALGQLAKFLRDKKIVWWNVPFTNPFPCPKPKRSNESDLNHASDGSKLPDIAAVLALGQIFAESEKPADQIVGAYGAIAMLAPTRVGEELYLPLDCEVAHSLQGRNVYGLSWRPEKGGLPKTNFVTSAEVEAVVRRAVALLTAIGAKARIAAAWYGENPNRLYVPQDLEHLRGLPVTAYEVALILGKKIEDRSQPRWNLSWLKKHGRITGKDVEGRTPIGDANWP